MKSKCFKLKSHETTFSKVFPKSIFDSLISQVSNLSKHVEFIYKKIDLISRNLTTVVKIWVRKNDDT